MLNATKSRPNCLLVHVHNVMFSQFSMCYIVLLHGSHQKKPKKTAVKLRDSSAADCESGLRFVVKSQDRTAADPEPCVLS